MCVWNYVVLWYPHTVSDATYTVRTVVCMKKCGMKISSMKMSFPWAKFSWVKIPSMKLYTVQLPINKSGNKFSCIKISKFPCMKMKFSIRDLFMHETFFSAVPNTYHVQITYRGVPVAGHGVTFTTILPRVYLRPVVRQWKMKQVENVTVIDHPIPNYFALDLGEFSVMNETR